MVPTWPSALITSPIWLTGIFPSPRWSYNKNASWRFSFKCIHTNCNIMSRIFYFYPNDYFSKNQPGTRQFGPRWTVGPSCLKVSAMFLQSYQCCQTIGDVSNTGAAWPTKVQNEENLMRNTTRLQIYVCYYFAVRIYFWKLSPSHCAVHLKS